MEKKYVKVPFDVEMAKRISNGEVDGKIITRDGRNVRVLCWDARGDLCIWALLAGKSKDDVGAYPNDGRIFMEGESPADLMLEVPEYMTLKDGDILYAKTNEFHYIFIYRDKNNDKTNFYAAIDDRDTLWIEDNRITSNDDISELRLATEEEKQKLIDAFKASKEPKAKEYLKRFFEIEEKQEYEFKPFDKVLVRDDNEKRWIPNFFWGKGDIMFRTIGGTFWNQCIPYNDQTAHLLGTTDDWEEIV